MQGLLLGVTVRDAEGRQVRGMLKDKKHASQDYGTAKLLP